MQAMQLSNGLSDPVGLWLGHLLFDSIFGVVAATLIVIIFAAVSNQFHGLGFFVRTPCNGLQQGLHSCLAACFLSFSDNEHGQRHNPKQLSKR